MRQKIKDILNSLDFTIVRGHDTFIFRGKLAWRLDRITDGDIASEIFLIFLLKAFVPFDLWLLKHSGNGILVLGIKQ